MNRNERNIILIGGAPTVGKSTVASELAGHFGIPWISTDQIRTVMRSVVGENDGSALFPPKGYSAERFLTEFSAEEIVDMEIAQGEVVWPSVKHFIDHDYTWTDGFVIEGVNILPRLVTRDYGEQKNIRSVFLVDEDADRIRHVVRTRGLFANADEYSDDVKEKEVEWVTLFSRRLQLESQECGFPTIEVTKSDTDLKNVLSVLDDAG